MRRDAVDKRADIEVRVQVDHGRRLPGPAAEFVQEGAAVRSALNVVYRCADGIIMSILSELT